MTNDAETPTNAPATGVEADRAVLIAAEGKGLGAKLAAHAKLSGPGWLQSAITLGGGTLAGCLFLGVIGGYEMLWLQPLMMFFGIVLLATIGYVTLSTGKRPFAAIRDEVNPVLAWGWLLASALANMVWAMPQFALGTAAVQQNLLPGVFDGSGKYIVIALIAIASLAVVWSSVSGGKGLKIFEIVLKIMVAIIVLSFVGVVGALATSKVGLPWGEIFSGFIPNFSLFTEPSSTYKALIPGTSMPEFWHAHIMSIQRDLMITAAATAVGINMTFLLPYSMLKRGWDRKFRGQANFDLVTALFIPFLLVTTCVMVASISRFHGSYDKGLVGEAEMTAASKKLVGSYEGTLNTRLNYELKQANKTATPEELKSMREALPIEDKRLAAMLVKRDSDALADSLSELTGKNTAQIVFGLGVFGMAISTIIVLMLINGYCLCEALNKPGSKKLSYIGTAIPAVTGSLGFIWLWSNSDAKFWLAVPTSVFGLCLLPIAAITFLIIFNSKRLLGDQLPTGGKRVAANIVLMLAVAASSFGAGWAIWSKVGWYGVAAIAIFLGMVLVAHLVRSSKQS